MIKLLIRTVTLAAAVGLPVLFFSASDIYDGARKSVTSLVGNGDEGEAKSKAPAPVASIPVATPNAPRLEGPQIRDFGDVFRFDVTTGWIMSHWARVSTGMSQLQLHGYRVPLVTGTRRDDLAGALTYYFGPEQRVRKITFNGTTGDATRFIRLMTSKYGLRQRPANDSGLFIYEAPDEDGNVRSVLRIRPTPVVRADQPFQRFHLDLTLTPPPQKG